MTTPNPHLSTPDTNPSDLDDPRLDDLILHGKMSSAVPPRTRALFDGPMQTQTKALKDGRTGNVKIASETSASPSMSALHSIGETLGVAVRGGFNKHADGAGARAGAGSVGIGARRARVGGLDPFVRNRLLWYNLTGNQPLLNLDRQRQIVELRKNLLSPLIEEGQGIQRRRRALAGKFLDSYIQAGQEVASRRRDRARASYETARPLIERYLNPSQSRTQSPQASPTRPVGKTYRPTSSPRTDTISKNSSEKRAESPLPAVPTAWHPGRDEAKLFTAPIHRIRTQIRNRNAPTGNKPPVQVSDLEEPNLMKQSTTLDSFIQRGRVQ